MKDMKKIRVMIVEDSPVVSALQRRKVPRVVAALLTAFVAFVFLTI